MTSSSNTETQTVVNEQNKTVAYASFLLHSMPLFSQAALVSLYGSYLFTRLVLYSILVTWG